MYKCGKTASDSCRESWIRHRREVDKIYKRSVCLFYFGFLALLEVISRRAPAALRDSWRRLRGCE